MTKLDKKISEYYSLKNMREALDVRLSNLRSSIIRDQGTLFYTSAELSSEIKPRKKVYYDEDRLIEILNEKNLWQTCCTLQPDESLIEQAYLEGKLTDEDLRYIREEQDSVALIVRKRDKDVQEETDILGE